MESMNVIVSIVERGKGASIQRLYRTYQIALHLQCAGRGTATSEILDILGLGSTEKDVVLSCAALPAARRLLHDLNNDLRGQVDTSGIVFDLPLTGLNSLVANLASFQAEALKKGNGGDPQMERSENSLILVACTRGCTDHVMATAKAQGARGGTVIKARLAGLEDLEQAYDIDLKAEREILAIVVPTKLRNDIMDAVNREHGLRHEAQAIVCSLPIEHMVRL